MDRPLPVDLPPPNDPALPAESPTADSQPITLSDFLKSIGWVGTGGQAKLLIQAGEVSVNGVTETRRRKKLQVGDQVRWSDQTAVVSQEHRSP